MSSVDRRLQNIQDELRSERQQLRKRQDEVGKISTELKQVGHDEVDQFSRELCRWKTRIIVFLPVPPIRKKKWKEYYKVILYFYRPQRSCGKVMFLQLSFCPRGRVCQTPPRQTPPLVDTPPDRHPQPETATAADDTHPTGMHSCMTVIFFLFSGIGSEEGWRRDAGEWPAHAPISFRVTEITGSSPVNTDFTRMWTYQRIKYSKLWSRVTSQERSYFSYVGHFDWLVNWMTYLEGANFTCMSYFYWLLALTNLISFYLQYEAELEKLHRRLDQSEGGKDALLDQVKPWFYCITLSTHIRKTATATSTVDSERLSSRTSFQLEDEVLDTSKP